MIFLKIAAVSTVLVFGVAGLLTLWVIHRIRSGEDWEVYDFYEPQLQYEEDPH